jgi:hypothetical protein
VKWFYQFVNMRKEDCVGIVAVEHVQLPKALEMLRDMAIERYPEWDRLVVFEHDMLPPIDGLQRIAGYADFDDSPDIVGSVYFRHEPPHNGYVYIPMPDQTDGVGVLSAKDIRGMVENPGLYPVAACGFGFTSIHRRVFENWDSSIPMFKFEQPWGSEDMWFCAMAQKQGFKVHIDSAIACGHLTLQPVTYADNQRFANVEQNMKDNLAGITKIKPDELEHEDVSPHPDFQWSDV